MRFADGSVAGNVYLDVRRVIALARASALPKVQKQYDEVTIGSVFDPIVEAAPNEAEPNEDAPN